MKGVGRVVGDVTSTESPNVNLPTQKWIITGIESREGITMSL